MPSSSGSPLSVEKKAFRRQLIELVAFRSRWTRQWITQGRDLDFAKSIGLDPDLLDEAATLLRSGFLPKPDGGQAIVTMDMFMPAVLGEEFWPLAESFDMAPVQLARSVWHTMLQTTREPSARTPRRWTESGEAKRVQGFGWRGGRRILSGPGRKHLQVTISVGLAEALGRRAAAYGATRNRYALLWLADLLDGLLADLVFPVISTDQMFDSAQGYVLPVVTTEQAERVPDE